MVQIVPNAALVQGTVTAVENYTAQPGFFVLSLLVAAAVEKKGVPLLQDDLAKKDIKILVSGDLQKKLNFKPGLNVKGEIKKTSPFLWRAVDESFKLVKTASKPAKK
jgi:hypothetical protein